LAIKGYHGKTAIWLAAVPMVLNDRFCGVELSSEAGQMNFHSNQTREIDHGRDGKHGNAV
jgi:hypothetical protein